MPFRKHAILQTHSVFYPHRFLVELMLNSSQFFKETCSNSRQLCCVDFISAIKIVVEFIRAHYTRISEFHLSTEPFKFSNKFSKNDFCAYYFVHDHSYNSSSENGRKTTASARAVSENFICNFDFHSWISSDGFRYKSS